MLPRSCRLVPFLHHRINEEGHHTAAGHCCANLAANHLLHRLVGSFLRVGAPRVQGLQLHSMAVQASQAVACPCCRLQRADNVFDAFERELAIPLLQCSFLAFSCTLAGLAITSVWQSGSLEAGWCCGCGSFSAFRGFGGGALQLPAHVCGDCSDLLHHHAADLDSTSSFTGQGGAAPESRVVSTAFRHERRLLLRKSTMRTLCLLLRCLHH